MASGFNANSQPNLNNPADQSTAIYSPAAAAPAARARNASQHYRRAQIETASPTQLVLMLFDGCIRFCVQGKEAMLAKNIEAQNTNLLKAQRIVSELIGSLNHEVGGEVAANLMRVYTFMLRKLVNANLHDDPNHIDEVVGMLKEIRASFQEADRQLSADAAAATTGPPVNCPANAAATPTEPDPKGDPEPATRRISPGRPTPAMKNGAPAPGVPAVRRLGDRNA